MHIHDYYYDAKPYIPWSLRMLARRLHAKRVRSGCDVEWPINEPASAAPEGWCGWPDSKEFAFVLTHDVEGPKGIENCRRLMELEMKHGFRSSFNFIPKGGYTVPADLRRELVDNGFEIGVHDLYHDGKLFRSEAEFDRHADDINRYLADWGAVGFRGGFMLRRLDWLHKLNIQYDASTFDTDPFEPQPHGVGTIFPFWVEPRSSNKGAFVASWSVSGQRQGYVELPYTLPQDSTLFLLLKERSSAIWLRKLDWIARYGGMALLDTHPDYMSFGRAGIRSSEYPSSLYEELLQYVKSRYSGAYWHALPSQVAAYYRAKVAERPAERIRSRKLLSRAAGLQKPRIWIDLDNTPHVPFFEPILEELKALGYPVLLTARDAFQVCELAEKKRLPFVKVGRHNGKSPLRKITGLVYRAMQLAPLVLRERPTLAVSHGARSQLILGNLLGIPTLLLEDYEHARFPALMRPKWVMAPTVIPNEALCGANGHVRKYSGIKEDVYAWKLQPDAALLTELGISPEEIIAIVRPPATEAHYHNPESERLFNAFMERACGTENIRLVLLPRNRKQGEAIRAHAPHWFEGARTIIPGRALDGMNLIWHSDLVVSGGGTMNREAAALGVPVYSIFRGTIGAVDRHLAAENRLVLIESVADVEARIKLVKRPRKEIGEVTSRQTLQEIVSAIEEIVSIS